MRDVDPATVDAVVIPGGWLPDKLRRYPEVTGLVRAVHDAGRPVGIICHGGLIAISAGIVGRDHPVTGSLGIRDDLVNAGGRWVDEPAFRDGTLVWGRVVDDIPAFERELVALLAEHNARGARARPDRGPASRRVPRPATRWPQAVAPQRPARPSAPATGDANANSPAPSIENQMPAVSDTTPISGG